MTRKLYAMDTHFHHDLGNYPLEIRCEMLQALGYDATYLTLWNDQAWEELKRLGGVKSRYGLDVAAVYHMPRLESEDTEAETRKALEILEKLPEGSVFELAVIKNGAAEKPSDPAGDERFLAFLEPVLEAVDPARHTVSLYPHINFWCETHEDAIRLCRSIGDPRLGMNFNALHWYARGAPNLPKLLDEAAPFLKLASLSGLHRDVLKVGQIGGLVGSIDWGHLDPFAVVAALEGCGYEGPVGFQGFSAGGDVYAILKRNLEAYRDIEARLRSHPNWGADFVWK